LKIAEWLFELMRPIARGTKVLVCSLDPRFRDLLEADRSVYSRHYQSVDAIFFPSIGDLLAALERGYDIVHLLCDLSPGGVLADSKGPTISGTELIAQCCEKDVKLLWVASGNKADDYNKGFMLNENRLNLIMTLDRRESRFSKFLDSLLSKVSGGKTIPLAWVAVAPQAKGPWEQDLPSCIFFTTTGDVKLLS
jgi:hypothetical protein